jgi:hypothetical protein
VGVVVVVVVLVVWMAVVMVVAVVVAVVVLVVWVAVCWMFCSSTRRATTWMSCAASHLSAMRAPPPRLRTRTCPRW